MFDTVVDLHKIIDQIQIAGDPIDSETMMGIIMGTNDEFQDPTKMGKLRDLRKYRSEILTKVVSISDRINSKLGKVTEKDIEKMADPFGIKEMRKTAKKDLEKKWDEIKKNLETTGINMELPKSPTSEKKEKDDSGDSVEQKVYGGVEMRDDRLAKKIAEEIANKTGGDAASILDVLKKNTASNEKNYASLNRLENYFLNKSGGIIDTLTSLFTLLAVGIVGLIAGEPLLKLVDKFFGTHLANDFSNATSNLHKFSGYILDAGKLLLMGLTVSMNTITDVAKGIKTAAFSTISKALSPAKVKEVSEVASSTKKITNPWKGAQGTSFEFHGEDGKKLSKQAFEKMHGVHPDKFKGVLDETVEIEKDLGGAAKEGSKLGAISKIGSKLGSMGKIFGKLLRGLPWIGRVMDIYTAISDIGQGDYTGGVLRLISAASTFLGPEFAIPIGIAVDWLDDELTRKNDGGGKPGKGKILLNMVSEWGKLILKTPFFKNIIDIGDAISKGDWKRVLKDAAHLNPLVGLFWDFCENASKEIKNDKAPISIGSIFQDLRKAFSKALVNMLPESIFGVKIRSWVAEKLGISDYGSSESEPTITEEHHKQEHAAKPSPAPTPKPKNLEEKTSSKQSVDTASELAKKTEEQNEKLRLFKEQTGIDTNTTNPSNVFSSPMNMDLNSKTKISTVDISKLNDFSSTLPKSISLDAKSMEGFADTMSGLFSNINQTSPSLSIGSTKGDEAIITGSRGDHIYISRTKWINTLRYQ
jgi:cell division FtsZ-interacting protein ZapD